MNQSVGIYLSTAAGVGYDLPISVEVAGLGFADGDLYFSYTAGVLSFEPTSGSFGGNVITSISFYKKLGLRFAYINLNVKESDRTPIS